jgi:hypothetical protein
MTRPASSLPPASYAHYWAGTPSALLTCGLGVSQVGLVLIRTHPLGNNNQFHEITLNSKASGLPWREHAFVRLSCCALLQVTLWDCQAASVEAIGSRPVFGVCVLTDGILDPANLLSEQNPP